MLRRLKEAALPFVQATDVDQVLETLNNVASVAGVRLYGIVPRHLVKHEDVGEKITFAASVPEQFRPT